MWALYGLIIGCGLLGLAVYWARQDAQKAERLQAVKQELQEAARVQHVLDTVDRLPVSAVRECLRTGKR